MTPPQFKTVPAEPTMGMYDDFLAAVANSSDPWFGGWADGWRAAVAAAPDSAPTLVAQLSALRQRVAELERDAGRYKWLRSRIAKGNDEFSAIYITHHTEDAWDRTIDAAISAQAKE